MYSLIVMGQCSVSTVSAEFNRRFSNRGVRVSSYIYYADCQRTGTQEKPLHGRLHSHVASHAC